MKYFLLEPVLKHDTHLPFLTDFKKQNFPFNYLICKSTATGNSSPLKENQNQSKQNKKAEAQRILGHWILLKYQTAVHLFAFLGLDLPQVELQFLAFQDVAVCPATLARPRSNASCGAKTKVFRCYRHQYKCQYCC